MESIEVLVEAGYNRIGEMESDGQTKIEFWAKKENNQWGYLVVNLSDDGIITDIIGIVNGRVIKHADVNY